MGLWSHSSPRHDIHGSQGAVGFFSIFRFLIFDFLILFLVNSFSNLVFSFVITLKQLGTFPFWMLCQHPRVSWKRPCDLLTQYDWFSLPPDRGSPSAVHSLSLAAFRGLPPTWTTTRSSDWGHSTNGKWQHVTETVLATNHGFHYPQEMQKNLSSLESSVQISCFTMISAYHTLLSLALTATFFNSRSRQVNIAILII